VLVGLGLSQLALFCTTVYLHRALAHRALVLRGSVQMVFRVLIWLMTGVRPRQWVAVHRKHHAFTDVAGDPHSPVLLGFWWVQLTNAALYRKVARDGVTTQRYAKDLPPDRLDKLLFDHAFLGLGVGIGALCLLLGWRWGLLAAAVHALSYLALNAAINAVGHSFGKRATPTRPSTTSGSPLSPAARVFTTTTTPLRHRPSSPSPGARWTLPGG
jgi:stearoyl-CoA desaturase (delta-9 desaturase)